MKLTLRHREKVYEAAYLLAYITTGLAIRVIPDSWLEPTLTGEECPRSRRFQRGVKTIYTVTCDKYYFRKNLNVSVGALWLNRRFGENFESYEPYKRKTKTERQLRLMRIASAGG